MARHKFYWDDEGHEKYDTAYSCLCGLSIGKHEVMKHIDDDDCEYYTAREVSS